MYLPCGLRMNATSAAISAGSPIRAIRFVRRNSGSLCGLQLFGETRGAHRTGIDGIDLDAILNSLLRHGFGEGQNRRVDRAADGEQSARSAAASTDDVDDRAGLLLQMRPGGAGETNGGVVFQGEAVDEIVVGEGFELAAFGGSGVVDHDVEGAEFFDGRVDCDRGRIGQPEIGGDDEGFLFADHFGGVIEQLLIAGAKNHAHAFGGEAQRDGVADASAGAGHDCGFFHAFDGSTEKAALKSRCREKCAPHFGGY